MKTRWKTLGDVPVQEIATWVSEATRNGQAVHVGTDSLQTGRYTQFCTVIAILNPGKGGRAAYCREVVPRINSLRERLLKEVWKSVEIAMALSVPGELTVHVDANPQERYMSSRYLQELVGLVVGQGFAVRIKPDAWCSSHAADHIVRSFGKLPAEVSQRGLNPRARKLA
jgi:predicted RNase H-related nuclease YkuK (DUF458 family)